MRFLFSPPPTADAPAPRLPRRALLLGGALLLLGLAAMLMPSQPPPLPRTMASPTSTAEATSHLTLSPRPGLITPGYVLVLAILGSGGVLAVYLRRKTLGTGTTPASLQTLGHLQLTPSQQLRLVSCGPDVLLLGITAGQITVLRHYTRPHSTLADPVSPASSPAPATPAPARTPPFAEVLQHYHRAPSPVPANG